MIYYGCDPGQVVCWLNREVTGTKTNIAQILRSVKLYISDSDFEHIERILTQGCPALLNYEEEAASKLAMMKRRNQKILLTTLMW